MHLLSNQLLLLDKFLHRRYDRYQLLEFPEKAKRLKERALFIQHYCNYVINNHVIDKDDLFPDLSLRNI